ncbi:hypothetical protein DUNSADRAFT_409 [Dunaliella salina]|uniref:Encoded protein n=1 Tax=Dunaliella salina TaxID=3046 RepID=A0ABQ7FZ16_DUNSA|nr:hypothetical protein DUNSADRAFT_409 [Dunaliella salina]|eukprot:KAF5827586.1 hypothetical protein DUNSADRAFT_409 [Dunaliella salina]
MDAVRGALRRAVKNKIVIPSPSFEQQREAENVLSNAQQDKQADAHVPKSKRQCSSAPPPLSPITPKEQQAATQQVRNLTWCTLPHLPCLSLPCLSLPCLSLPCLSLPLPHSPYQQQALQHTLPTVAMSNGK